LYVFLVSDKKGFTVPVRRDIELAEQAIAEALYDAHNDGVAAGLSARKEELERLYEWKRQSEDMDKRKTVEVVDLRAEVIAAERRGRIAGLKEAAEIARNTASVDADMLPVEIDARATALEASE